MDNRIPSAFAIIAGALLIVSRPPGSVFPNAWWQLFETLEKSGSELFSVLALLMAILVQLGGLTVVVGGVLCYKNHLRTGKELIGIGTGVGLADLLLLTYTGQLGPPAGAGWVGLVLVILAGRHIHGPEASYAGEIRKLLGGLRARLTRKRRKQARRRRSRRLRQRQARSLTGQYDGVRDKKGEGKRPSQ